jgi:ligand-binding SRPBCC domain-containing protein
MRVHELRREQRVPRRIDEVFSFFADPQNLERLTPSWLGFELIPPLPGPVTEGTLINYRLHLHGVPVRWTSRIDAWEPGRRFIDRQLRGPYRYWHHTHSFVGDGDDTVIRDHVRYALPFGVLGSIARRLLVTRDLERIFEHRRLTVERIFGAAAAR